MLSNPEPCPPYQVAVSPRQRGSGQTGIMVMPDPAPGPSALQSSAGVPPRLGPAGGERSSAAASFSPGPPSLHQPRAGPAAATRGAVGRPGGGWGGRGTTQRPLAAEARRRQRDPRPPRSRRVGLLRGAGSGNSVRALKTLEVLGILGTRGRVGGGGRCAECEE